jgi:hypothetical protein
MRMTVLSHGLSYPWADTRLGLVKYACGGAWQSRTRHTARPRAMKQPTYLSSNSYLTYRQAAGQSMGSATAQHYCDWHRRQADQQIFSSVFDTARAS